MTQLCDRHVHAARDPRFGAQVCGGARGWAATASMGCVVSKQEAGARYNGDGESKQQGDKPADDMSVVNASRYGPEHVTTLLSQPQSYTGMLELNVSMNDLLLLPDGIGEFTQLVKLDVSSNKLNQLPAAIGKLANLEVLDCNDNELKALPAEIGECTKLHTLLAYRNAITSLPDTIGQLQNLNELNVFNNKVLSLPASLGTLSRAEQINLAANKMFKVDPPVVAGWTSVEVLNIYDCRLLRLAPLSHMQALKELRLFGNQLREVPTFGDGLPKLQLLELHRNDIAEVPPGVFDGMGELTKLNLSRNKLKSLPANLAGAKLQSLLLDENELENIPSDIATMPALTVLLLNSNRIASLPSAFLDNRIVQRVNVKDNPLNDSPQAPRPRRRPSTIVSVWPRARRALAVPS